jgi:hypothetical protein|tara:strand:- start:401 stop:571 length:171 start_codon:yes stop_codon:yes gene_type:complete
MSKKQKEFDEKKRQLRVANYLKQQWGIQDNAAGKELKNKLIREGKFNEKAWNQRRV